MTARSLIGCFLLVLASIAVTEITLDASTAHAALRHQWRARAQHHATFRVSQRSGPAVTADVPPPVLTALGPVVPPDQPDALPLVAVSVFVPPRV